MRPASKPANEQGYLLSGSVHVMWVHHGFGAESVVVHGSFSPVSAVG